MRFAKILGVSRLQSNGCGDRWSPWTPRCLSSGVAAASITSGRQITEMAKDSADQPALTKVHGRLGVVGWLSLAMECSLL